MNQTEAFEFLLSAMIAVTHPRLGPRLKISVGGTSSKLFTATSAGARVSLHFSWPSTRHPELEAIVFEAAQAAEQLLFGRSRASSIALDEAHYARLQQENSR